MELYCLKYNVSLQGEGFKRRNFMKESILKTFPAVFAVGKDYQICVLVSCEALMWVRVGDECYYR